MHGLQLACHWASLYGHNYHNRKDVANIDVVLEWLVSGKKHNFFNARRQLIYERLHFLHNCNILVPTFYGNKDHPFYVFHVCGLQYVVNFVYVYAHGHVECETSRLIHVDAHKNM